MKYRIEKDAIGEMQIPAEAYYGIHTLRSHDNFDITKRGISRQMIKALAIVKKAAAKANLDAENLDPKVAKAIMTACDEILNGKLHGQFITDLIQGGAGTSINMNANEVIANRANELLGGKKGEYNYVHPMDHVNKSQSTNDVLQTSGKIAVIKQIKKLSVELKKLQNSFLDKAKDFEGIIKIGRTHMQEAVPLSISQEFNSYASLLGRDLKRLDLAIDALSSVNMGATAIGTGLNANPKYMKKVITYLSKYSGEELRSSKDLIDATANLDSFVFTSSIIKTLAVDLSKIANDISLLSSTSINEIILPKVQQGSTIMPGKYDPVIPEVVNQVSYYIMGLDVTVTKACEAGQLELNVFQPVILMCLFDELTNIRHATRTFNNLAIAGIDVNKDACQKAIDNSFTLITAITPSIGYDEAYKIADESKERGINIKDIILEKGLLTEDEIDKLLDPKNMISPGIKTDTEE